MGLEEVLQGIDKKVKQEIEKIRNGAEKKKQRILEEAKQEAKRRQERITGESKRKIDDEMEKALINARREERKKILNLKRELIDSVFEEAKSRFLNMDNKEYLSLIKDILLSNLDGEGEEVVISPQDKELISGRFVQEIEKSLSRRTGKNNVKLKLVPELDETERGFIIRKERMQVNCTLSSLFTSVKDRIEIEVAKRLFQ